MLRASRREDRKRVPQYSSCQLPFGAALVRTYGNLPGSVSGTPARHPVGVVPPARGPGPAPPWLGSPSGDFRRGDATRPTAWVGAGREPHRVPERLRETGLLAA